LLWMSATEFGVRGALLVKKKKKKNRKSTIKYNFVLFFSSIKLLLL
jgi:hypothetical protein